MDSCFSQAVSAMLNANSLVQDSASISHNNNHYAKHALNMEEMK